ncbi:hypothetical protein [Aestuariivirga litoralis]|nr:hypothetical protein [Aestuariivirga litoralis]
MIPERDDLSVRKSDATLWQSHQNTVAPHRSEAYVLHLAQKIDHSFHL